MANDIDDIVNDVEPVELEEPVEAEVAEEPTAEVESEVTAEEPVEVEAEAAPEEEPEAPKAEAKTVPLPALTEERTKRQEAEAKAKVLEEMIARQQAQPAEPPKPVPVPDPIADPEGFAKFTQAQIEQKSLAATLNLSESIAREKHGDEAVDAALKAAQAAGPDVFNKFQYQPNAYGALLKWHEQQRVATEVGDPVAFKEKLKSEVRAEIMAEMVAEQAKVQAGKAAPSLAGETSVGSRNSQPWSGPPAIDDILG